VLRLENVPDPVPGAGDVLVRIEAAGLNFIEVYYRKGLYKTALPYTPGSEGAGIVVAVSTTTPATRSLHASRRGSAGGASPKGWGVHS